MQHTFCLLKSEAYLFGHKHLIRSRLQASGLEIIEHWQVRLRFADIFRMYDHWIPRLMTVLRLPPLFLVDLYIVTGRDAINRMYRLKHAIRNEIWGFEYRKGGFLHAPDSAHEFQAHLEIIKPRIVHRHPTVAPDTGNAARPRSLL